jgi:hypothetical protein
MNKEPQILLQVVLTHLISVTEKNSLLIPPTYQRTRSAAETHLAKELLYVYVRWKILRVKNPLIDLAVHMNEQHELWMRN